MKDRAEDDGLRMFGPRTRERLDDKLPPVRMTRDERAAVGWLIARMSRRQGFLLNISDMIRILLGEALRREVQAAEAAGEDLPEEVLRVRGSSP